MFASLVASPSVFAVLWFTKGGASFAQRCAGANCSIILKRRSLMISHDEDKKPHGHQEFYFYLGGTALLCRSAESNSE